MIQLKVSQNTISKANRIYKFFKPEEIVQGEPFEITLTFENIGEKFHGGFFSLVITQRGLTVPVKQIDIPPLEESEVKVITISDIAVELSGACGMEFRNQHYQTTDRGTVDGIYLWSATGMKMHDGNFLFLPISSKEEIYQKYSLVVSLIALAISLVALLFAAIDLLARILSL